MELTHVRVQGTNPGSPPRLAQAITLPLDQLWSRGIDPKTREQVLRVLSRVAAPIVMPLRSREARNE